MAVIKFVSFRVNSPFYALIVNTFVFMKETKAAYFWKTLKKVPPNVSFYRQQTYV